MGRTLPSMTQVFYQQQESFADFRRSLRRADQLALDDLFVAARKHLSAAAYASHPLPFEIFLLAMLLEEHKETQRLRQQLAQPPTLLAGHSAFAVPTLPAGYALLPALEVPERDEQPKPKRPPGRKRLSRRKRRPGHKEV